MTAFFDQIWPLAEPVIDILVVCALLGGAVGGVYGVIVGFFGE